MTSRNLHTLLATYRREIGFGLLLLVLSGAAAGAVAYAQSIEGPVGDLVHDRPAPATRGLEEFADELRTRERLLSRKEQNGVALSSAEQRLVDRLDELQKLREQVEAQLLELQSVRRETAAELAELAARRQTEQSVLDSWRKEQLEDIDIKRKSALAELEFHRTEASKVIEDKQKEILSEMGAGSKEEETLGLIQMVEAMRPAEAASILSEVDEKLAVRVLDKMARTKAGKALAQMTPQKAAALAERMAVPPSLEALGLPSSNELLGDPAAALERAGSGSPPVASRQRPISPVKPPPAKETAKAPENKLSESPVSSPTAVEPATTNPAAVPTGATTANPAVVPTGATTANPAVVPTGATTTNPAAPTTTPTATPVSVETPLSEPAPGAPQ